MKSKSIFDLQKKYNHQLGYCMSDCPPGWYETVDNMIQKLILIPTFNLDDIAQIKSKFAGLRTYIDRGNLVTDAQWKQINQIIDDAELQCREICEDCGKSPAKVFGTGWIFRLCDICITEHKEKHQNL